MVLDLAGARSNGHGVSYDPLQNISNRGLCLSTNDNKAAPLGCGGAALLEEVARLLI
jgi:hypothetical protein